MQFNNSPKTIQLLIKKKSKDKLGLVLEGGGGKGAYAFGCLIALRKAGFSFDAIAGTSVGALNAMIWSTNQLAFGNKIWDHITTEQVLKCRKWFIIRLFFQVLLTISGIFRYKGVKWNTILNIMLPVIITNFTMFTIILLYRLLVSWEWDILTYISIWGLLSIVLSALSYFLFNWSKKSFFSIFDQSPLEQKIKQLLNDTQLKSTIYLTLTEYVNILDPDYTKFIKYRKTRSRPVESAVPIPNYIRIDKDNTDLWKKVILASTAIPFGVFPSVVINSTEFVDGGVSDNTPIYPLIELESCEKIIVIRLRPEKINYKLHWANTHRIQKLKLMGNFKAWKLYKDYRREKNLDYDPGIYLGTFQINPPEIIPLEEPIKWPSFIGTIQPSQSLGNFFSGTMNFSPKYASKLIDLGFKDATTFINENQALFEKML